MKDPYEVLGVARNASEEELKKVYKTLSKKYHPDNRETGSTEKFREVKNAYDAAIKNLSTPTPTWQPLSGLGGFDQFFKK